MNINEFTDVVYNALKLNIEEYILSFDDYTPNIIHIEEIESGECFKLTITKSE